MRIPAKAEPFMYVDTYLQEYEQKKKLVFNLFQTCLVEVQFLQIHPNLDLVKLDLVNNSI